MNFEINTSLRLRTTSSSLANQELNLDLVLDRSSSSSSSSPSSPMSPADPRVFSCTYCKRKFYSSQALGGHQNAHKLERTLAKKSRELSSGGVNNKPQYQYSSSSLGFQSNSSSRSVHEQLTQFGHQGGYEGRFLSDRRMLSYGRREIISHGSSEEEINHLDLSLRL